MILTETNQLKKITVVQDRVFRNNVGIRTKEELEGNNSFTLHECRLAFSCNMIVLQMLLDIPKN